MQSSGLWKPVLVGLLLALVVYIGGFTFDEYLRTRRGPWRVTFARETNGAPVIIVNQPRLHITNLKIIFAGETASNTPATVVFDVPQKPVPSGKVKFEDLTYLPGTVTFDLFGHEIELIPRTLYINRKARLWESDATITLTPTDKPAALPVPKPGKKKY